MAERLKVPLSQIAHRWQRPVEDQNHEAPPSRIVAALFNEFGSAPYDKVSDAPWILNHSDYRLIQERCPQQFSPFVKFLEAL